MSIKLKILCLILYISTTKGLVEPTLSELENPNCTILYTNEYSDYRTSFHLNKWKENGIIKMNFSIQGTSNAHIMLTPYPVRSMNDNSVSFEIVLGAGGNSYSSVRRKPRLSKPYMINTADILHNYRFTHFWMIIDKYSLEIGKKNLKAFLTFRDNSFSNMKYISFGAWNGVTLTWKLGCDVQEKEEVQSKTDIERLMNDVLETYDPFIVPEQDSTLIIDTKIEIFRVNLDAKLSSLTTYAKVNMEWFDPKLQWDPIHYNGISHLTFYMRKVWRPDLVVINQMLGEENKNIFDFSTIRVYSNGSVLWSPNIIFKTRCNTDMSNWPWDKQICEINLGLYQNSDHVHLSLNETPNMFEDIHSQEWKIDEIQGESTLVKTLDSNNPADNSLSLKLHLTRQKSSFIYIFVLPIIVLAGLIPSMFCLPPLSNTKTYINLSSILVLLILLLTEESMLPALTNSTPKIIKLTSKLLFFLCLQTSLFSIMKHIGTLKTNPPHWVLQILKNRCVSLLLLNICPIEESKQENDEINLHWALMAMFLDRLLQIIIIIIVIPIEIALTMSY